MPRNPGGRLGLLDDHHIGIRPSKPLALVTDPGGTRPRLAVGQSEDEVAEQLGAGAEGGLGGIGGEAADEQELGVDSPRHARQSRVYQSGGSSISASIWRGWIGITAVISVARMYMVRRSSSWASRTVSIVIQPSPASSIRRITTSGESLLMMASSTPLMQIQLGIKPKPTPGSARGRVRVRLVAAAGLAAQARAGRQGGRHV